MRHRTVSMLGVLFVLVCGNFATPAWGATVPHRADGNIADWVGEPTWLSGESRISQGELIHDDWLYDDYGADIDQATNTPEFRGYLAPTQGDYRYPTNSARYGYNAADIRQVRVAADASGLHVVVFLQTLKNRDAAAVTLAIDNGRGPTDLEEWPDGVGLTTPGVDYWVTGWGRDGWITDARGKRERLRRQWASLDDNAVEFDVPWRFIPHVRGRTVKLFLVSGLADPQAKRYMTVPLGDPTSTAPGGGGPGSTAVFDVAFDREEVPFPRLLSHWGETAQSQDLASRDVARFGYDADLGALEAGVTDTYSAVPGRFYNRIFRSGQSYGEGITLKNNPSSAGGSPDPQFLSPYQPYGLYIPSNYQPGAARPLLLNGHSLDVNHNEYEAVSPNLFNQLGEQRSSFVITPLARGMDTWYIDSGFIDVMEAWEDLKAHYTIDGNRTAIGGYSMGGYMTYRMGLLMPDKFSAAVPYVGPPAYQIWAPPNPPQPGGPYQFVGHTTNIVHNALNLPFEINNGALDELVPVAGAEEHAKAFRDVGYTHQYYLYPSADHFALIGADEWGHTRDWLNTYPQRNLNPIEVNYRRYPAMDLPQHGLRFDGAYWVDGMELRGSDSCSPGQSCQTTFGHISAYNAGSGAARFSQVNDEQFAYPGPPFPAEVRGKTRVYGPRGTPGSSFDTILTNLRAVTFDIGLMNINPNNEINGKLTISSGSQGPFTLRLRGSFPPVTATIQELPLGPVTPVPVTPTADGIELELNLNSQHNLKITPQ